MLSSAVIVGFCFLLTCQNVVVGQHDVLSANDTKSTTRLEVSPEVVMLTKNDTTTLYFHSSSALQFPVSVHFNSSPFYELESSDVLIPANSTASLAVHLRALSVGSDELVQPASCSYVNSADNASDCPFDKISDSVVHLTVVHSYWLLTLCNIIGWIYFVAWSISFYPQIWLNFSRKSVVGLNFDFIALNLTGFTCYTVYNVIMFWDANVQALYEKENPHSMNPVLLNDVVFAIHALFACAVTAVQCSIYERANQRVSYLGGGLTGVFCLVALGSLAVALFQVINWLVFIRILSYIKIGVTLSKYFPQAFFNYRRKSTVGWSIGNILLDFTGGTMDILQMVLQSLNTDDWRNFTGNVVKFLLGLISIAFDILFIVQHYVLYRNAPDVKYEPFAEGNTSTASLPSAGVPVHPGYGSTEVPSTLPQDVQ